MGSYAELFGNPNWHKGAMLAVTCIVAIIVMAFAGPSDWPKLPIGLGLAAVTLAGGMWMIFGGKGGPWRRNAAVGLGLACVGVIGLWGIGFFAIDLNRSVLQKHFAAQGLTAAALAGKVTFWSGVTSMMLNVGAFFGIYCFGLLAQKIGRVKTFAIAFMAALFATAYVFLNLRTLSDIFWMLPIMGFCQLAAFGGYAIYFPELFPTHLRSTGTSFCYNVGRFVAASGPAILGLLTSRVFDGTKEPMRYAGATMCAVFLLGLLILPFAQETKGQPLPEGERGFTH